MNLFFPDLYNVIQSSVSQIFSLHASVSKGKVHVESQSLSKYHAASWAEVRKTVVGGGQRYNYIYS